MFNLVELIWPRLDPLSVAELRVARERDIEEISKIRRQPWKREIDTALEEARRLTETEAERRRTADTKAATYLTVVGVLTPILSSFGPLLADTHASLTFRAVSSLILIVAVLYLVRAGLWAFHALRVGVAHRVDTGELTSMWARPRPKSALVGQLLEAAYLNRKPVNEKVSSIKMTDEFLVRAFVTFAFLLIVQSGWKPTIELWKTFLTPHQVPAAKVTGQAPPMRTPRVQALSEVSPVVSPKPGKVLTNERPPPPGDTKASLKGTSSDQSQ